MKRQILAMVGGADKLCDYLADGKHTVRVEVIASKALLPLSGYGLLSKTYSNLFYGADYNTPDFDDFHRSVWICMPRHAVRVGAIPEENTRKEPTLKYKAGSRKMVIKYLSQP